MNCKNCLHYRPIRRWTYNDEGVKHERPEGFACIAMAQLDEPVIHMIGTRGVGCEMFDDKRDICEDCGNRGAAYAAKYGKVLCSKCYCDRLLIECLMEGKNNVV